MKGVYWGSRAGTGLQYNVQMPTPPLRIINAPFDLCGRSPGSRLGPAAARLAGLSEELRGLNLQIDPREGGWDLESSLGSGDAPLEVQSLARCLHLKKDVARALDEGRLPLVIGGDHSLSIGSVSGALSHFGETLGVLWIDAHMDLNSPDVSVTMNIHGMPLAALLRIEEKAPSPLSPYWARALGEVVPNPGLQSPRLGGFGLREVDDEESGRFHSLDHPYCKTMDDVDLQGMSGCLSDLEQWVRSTGMTALWVSFDVDSIDPMYAPGTGTTVRGGLTFREGHALAERLHDILLGPSAFCPLAGVDVVEINPILDHENMTARVAVGWLASLFGKKIIQRPKA
jgi:arginase